MPFALTDAAVPATDEVRDALAEEWGRLAAPGTWMSGAERVAAARAARTGIADVAGVDAAVAEVAVAVMREPGTITGAWIADAIDRVGRVERYVEAVGVVARLSAVDTCVLGVGAATEPLPEPVAGEPSRQPNPAARRRRAAVPTDGVDSLPRMLSAVPAEAQAQMRLHGALYLTEEETGDHALGTELTRPQMELVASRVSHLNHCVF